MNLDRECTRKEFVVGVSKRLLAVAVVARKPGLFLPPSAATNPIVTNNAQEWIAVGPEPEERSQEQWFPFSQSVADTLGLMTMYAKGGPLDIHDEVLGHHGPRGLAREWAEDYANYSLSATPWNRTWIGYCHAVANTMAFHEPLTVKAGESFEYEGLTVNRSIIMGLYAASHAHDAEVAHRSDPAGIRALLRSAIIKGWAPVANIPGANAEGQIWSYKITFVRPDLEVVIAHNFGKTVYSYTDAIAGIYFPFSYNPNDPETYRDLNADARAKTLGYFNPELNPLVVEQIVQNRQV